MKILLATVLATGLVVPAMANEPNADQNEGKPEPKVVQPQMAPVQPGSPSIRTEGRGPGAADKAADKEDKSEHEKGEKGGGGGDAGGAGGGKEK
jgi:hypothetical protein